MSEPKESAADWMGEYIQRRLERTFSYVKCLPIERKGPAHRGAQVTFEAIVTEDGRRRRVSIRLTDLGDVGDGTAPDDRCDVCSEDRPCPHRIGVNGFVSRPVCDECFADFSQGHAR